MHNLANHIVMLTGAAGDLGRAVASAFDVGGAKLALLDNQENRLQMIYEDWDQASKHLMIGSVDVSDADSVAKAVSKIEKHYGGIDTLINIAGGYRAGDPVHETAVESWDFMFKLNARSAFLTSRAVVPIMLSKGSGAIVNIGARPGVKGVARAAAYSASKSAVIRLTESQSAELKHQGINVNCVLPGTIDTPKNREAMPNAKQDRWVKPEAIAEVILFLASDAARAIHGAAIPVYGKG